MKKHRIYNKEIKYWDEVEYLKDFSCPWTNEDESKTLFQAYYDNENINFRFLVECVKPNIYIKNNNKLEVINSERVEIFFRKNDSMSSYYCLEIDPLSRVLDYKAKLYREFDRSWEWPDLLHIKSKITEKMYSIEGKISFFSLKELDLIKNNQIQIGLYRGNCIKLEDDKAKINWISWVDPKTEFPDFHVASSFGLLQL